MRRALAMVMALGLLASAALPVLAGGKPEWVANEPADPLEFAAGEVCDFDLRIADAVNTGHTITFPESNGSQRVLGGGHLVTTVTNLESNEAVTLNISGPGKLVFRGDLLSLTGGGPWLIYLFPGDVGGAGLWFTRGAVALDIDLVSGAVVSLSLPRNSIDVCELLGGAAAD